MDFFEKGIPINLAAKSDLEIIFKGKIMSLQNPVK